MSAADNPRSAQAARGRAPLVIAHRGAWTTTGVENSLAAFEAAIELGADMIELDIRRTRDGELVVHHDAHRDGVPLATLSRAELARMLGPIGGPPTLREVVETVGGRIALDVELKERGYVGEVLALVAPLGGQACLLTSFDDEVVRECKHQAPELRAGLIIADPDEVPIQGPARRRCLERAERRVDACGADCVALQLGLLDAWLPELARAARFQAFAWTVNDAQTLGRLMADRALTGVITDQPGLALSQRCALSERTGRAAPS